LRKIRRPVARVPPFYAEAAVKPVDRHALAPLRLHWNHFDAFIHWFTAWASSTGERLCKWGGYGR